MARGKKKRKKKEKKKKRENYNRFLQNMMDGTLYKTKIASKIDGSQMQNGRFHVQSFCEGKMWLRGSP